MATSRAGHRAFHLAFGVLSFAACGALAVDANGQPTTDAPRRMLYVADSSDIVGDPDAEARLIARARAWNVSELALYGLAALLDPRDARLARFAERAHAAGLALIAPIAGIDRVDAIARYERTHPSAHFAGWVTELEYWHECGALESGRRPCFDRLDRLLSAMERAASARADRRPWLGVYVGYPTAEEALEIGRRADRVFLNYHGRDPESAYTRRASARYSIEERLARFAGTRARLWPILYARGEVHMERWLGDHDAAEAERELAALAAPHGRRFDGFAWFDYGALDRIERVRE